MTFPDNPKLQDWRKVTRRGTLRMQSQQYSFQLTAHKADKFFEGNIVLIRGFSSPRALFNPFPAFCRYLSSRDSHFPALSPLWLTSEGEVPTRSFFMSRFRAFFSKNYGGVSMRAGGATHLALNGAPASIIRAMGRWSSEAWEVYIRVHPTLLQALLHQH